MKYANGVKSTTLTTGTDDDRGNIVRATPVEKNLDGVGGHV